jgi:transcriptional regulator with XRE-family HTH domain
MDDFDKALGARIRLERESRGWSLSDLAEKSGVSRAMINNVERGAASPTAALLGRLSGAFGLTMSTLLARAEMRRGGRLLRAAEQPLWQDPKSGYVRRHVAPMQGSDLPFDIVKVEMPAGASVDFPAASYLFIRQVVWVLEGELCIAEGGVTHRLQAGDSLEFGAPADSRYHNDTERPCLYAVVVLKTGQG